MEAEGYSLTGSAGEWTISEPPSADHAPATAVVQRSTELALRLIRLHGALPKTATAQIIGTELLRVGTAAGAGLRAATSASTREGCLAGIESSLGHLASTRYFVELLGESGIMAKNRLGPLEDELASLSRILCAVLVQERQAPGGG